MKHKLLVTFLLCVIVFVAACNPSPIPPTQTPSAREGQTEKRIAELEKKLVKEKIAIKEVPIDKLGPTPVPAPTTTPTAPPTTEPRPPQETIISWEEATDYVGQYKIVEGTIVRTYYAKTSKGKPTFLNFHDPYQDYFYCLIWGDDRPNFPPDPEKYYLNKRVHVRGPIETYEGVPQIILYEPSQIRLAEAGQEWEGIASEVRGNVPVAEVEARVIRVIDGDTIEIEGGQRVRYIGIDTPETVHPSKAVECFGKEATKTNSELVEGKKVRLESDVADRDKYGRLLRYVYVDDLMVNAELVRLGYAYSSSYPPNVKYQQLFLQLEREAREQEKGLWEECE